MDSTSRLVSPDEAWRAQKLNSQMVSFFLAGMVLPMTMMIMEKEGGGVRYVGGCDWLLAAGDAVQLVT